MGGKTTSIVAPRINNLAIQTSALGITIPKGWGTNRIKCNLVWYGDFTAISHTEKSGGKGGGGVKQTTYTYEASIIMGLAVGPINSVKTVYKDKDVYGGANPLSDAGLSLAVGTYNQSTWSYLSSVHPTEALNYSNLAYVYASNYPLNDGAGLQNHSFEVQFAITAFGSPDANAADILDDFFYNSQSGVPGWGAGMLGDLTSYREYGYASQLLVSPVLEQQIDGTEFLNELGEVTNSDIFWSEGVIKVKPRGDATVSHGGHTWVPDLTPVYDLDENNFLVDGPDDAPVTQEIKDEADCYNIVQIEYLDRSNQYNTAIMPAQDLDDIILNGKRKEDVLSWHSICDAQVAQQVAQLRLQRNLYIRSTYKFRLPWDFALLEPTDYVTLTTHTDELYLDRVLVKIIEIEEDEYGTLTFTAEEVPVNSASAAMYPPHSSSGYVPDTSASPGDVVNPAIVNAPTSLTGGAPELWIGAGSDNPNWGGCDIWLSADDTNFTYIGRIDQPARYGLLTSALASHVDPDPTGSFNVNMTNSSGLLTAASTQDLDVASTLAFIDSELISYKDVGLTSAYNYTLSNLKRGLYGTTPASHAVGAKMLRVDDNVYKLAYESLGLGKTAYIKLTSFNVWGKSLQDLADVNSYSVNLVPLSVGVQPLGAFSLVATTNMFIEGSRVKKIGNTAAWNESVRSRESFSNGAFVSFVADQNNKVLMVGLNTDPATNNSFDTIDYAWYLMSAGTYQIWENGSQISGISGSYSTGDIFSISYDNGNLVYKRNGTAVRTVSVSAGLVLYLDTSFNDVFGSISALTFASIGRAGVDGAPGSPGADGANNARPLIYKRSATSPTLPSATTTYTFATGVLTGLNNGWSTSIPADDGNPCWVSGASASSNTATDTIAAAEWAAATQMVVSGATGSPGTPGVNTATVYLYQRATSAPAVPSATVTYTFSTGAVAGVNNGWSTTIPAGSNPIYVVQATALGTGSTDTIATGEWSTPQVLAQNGSNGSNGLNTAIVPIYQRAASAPTLPSATTTYDFTAKTLTGLNNGWSTTVPAVNGNPLWVSAATASSSGTTDTIASGEWPTPTTMAQDGATGSPGNDGLNQATVRIYKRSASAPALPSASTTYTFSNGALSGLNNGWSTSVPNNDGNPLYTSQATAISTSSTDTIASGEWAAATIMAQDYFTWVAYADAADGSVNFTTGAPGTRSFIGIATNKSVPIESTVASDYTWSQYTGPALFGLVNGANCTISSNKIIKTGGSGAAWDASAYSSESWINGAYLTFVPVATTATLMVGLNTDPTTNVSWDTLDYAWYLRSDAVAEIRESGGGTILTSAYTANSVFSIQYDGANVRYYLDGVLKRTVAASANLKFYLDTSFVTVGGAVTIYSFAPQGSIGPQGPQGNTGNTGAPGRDAMVYFQDTTPSSPSVGDTWYAPTSQIWRRWNGSSWVQLLGDLATLDIISNSAYIGSAVIGTANIADLQVTTIKIGNNAVIQPSSAFTPGTILIPTSSSGSSRVTIQSITVSSVTGYTIPLEFGCEFGIDITDPSGFYFSDLYFELYRNGVRLFYSQSKHVDQSPLYSESSFYMGLDDTPGTGTFTYTLECYSAGAGARSLIYNRLIRSPLWKK